MGVQEVRVRVQDPSLPLSSHTPMAHRAAGMSTAPSPLFAPARSANGRADPVLPATGRATIRRKADFPPERAEGSSGSPTRSARFVAGEFRVLLGIPDRPRSASTRWTARRWAQGRCRTRHAEELGFCEAGPSANASSMAGLRPAGASSTSSMGTSIALAARRGGLPGTPSAAYHGRPG